MAKQQEIRELVLKYIGEAMLGNHNEDDIESLADSLLLDVSNKGVVIRGEAELPYASEEIFSRLTYEVNLMNPLHGSVIEAYRLAQQDLGEANLIHAVEPLIE